MDIQVFVFNYAHFDQAMSLFNSFTGLGYDTYLLNCQSPHDPPFEATNKILKFPNIYYTGQWNEALRLANKEVLFLINADVKVKNPAKLMRRMHNFFTQFGNRAGIYAPNFYWTPWTFNPQLLPHLGDNVRRVPMTDSTVWAISTPLAMKTGEIPLSVNRLGWGIEIVAAYYASLENLLVVKDFGIKLEHPHETAYDRGHADRQFRTWIDKLHLGQAFWDYYDTRDRYEFGWMGDDEPPTDDEEKPARQILLA